MLRQISLDNVNLQDRTSIEVLCILGLMLISFLSCLSMNIFQIYFYESIGYFINIFVLSICFGIYIIKHYKIKQTEFKLLLFSGSLIFYCIISAILTNGGYRYAGTVMNTVILVIILRDSSISLVTIRNTCIAMMIIMLMVAFNASGYYDNQFATDAVNSNYIAQLAVAGMIYINYFLCYFKGKYELILKIIRIFFDLVAFYILWECQSRGSLLAIIFFLFMFYGFPKDRLKINNIITIMSAIIAFVGVLITYIYVQYIVYLELEVMGKSTLTRSRLWTFFWDNIDNNYFNYLIGYGTRDEMRDIFGYGFHNIYLGIWYDIGLIGLILFTGFILWNIKKVYTVNHVLDEISIYGMIGFMAFQVSDYFAITFTGPLVIWNYIILGFISRAQKRKIPILIKNNSI